MKKKQPKSSGYLSFESLNIPPQIILSKSYIAELLCISYRQLERDIQVLNALKDLGLKGWQHFSRANGFNWHSAECLWEFRQLVQQYNSRQAAIHNILETMERIYERRHEGSGRTEEETAKTTPES